METFFLKKRKERKQTKDQLIKNKYRHVNLITAFVLLEPINRGAIIWQGKYCSSGGFQYHMKS